ncbi:amino acid permease-domain-containing protein [Lasiosphaeria hispida]|uniref:Amino acid permease-domain-containing protein n=1 Tax=Lasiosphaeria hispida TaxID=260671 RepID=A0AAJ0MF44_9PEZI|nr:amino acid permease-domain-containing protein [Lasiosphaeria hispida]
MAQSSCPSSFLRLLYIYVIGTFEIRYLASSPTSLACVVPLDDKIAVSSSYKYLPQSRFRALSATMGFEFDPHHIRVEVSDNQTNSLPLTQRDREAGSYSDFTATATVRKVKEEHHLSYLSTASLTFNRTIGTAIFVSPATILEINGSKTMCIILWLLGGVLTWAGMIVYLEYGIRWPLDGGGLHYTDRVWTRPRKFWTYLYGVMFVLLGGSQANAIIFSQAALTAASPGSPQDPRLVRAFAIFLVASICLFQSFSRINYIRFSNAFAIYKVLLLTFITIAGLLAVGGFRFPSGPQRAFGLTNLANDLAAGTYTAYGTAISLLLIMRAYAGYEVVNYVLEEVRRPHDDPNKVYRRSLKLSVSSVTFFYVMVNVAFFATCSTDELLTNRNTFALFISKVFGNSADSRVVAGVMLCFSAGGAVVSFIYTNVRVLKEIARMGIIPLPEFWATTTRYNTPGPALLLHFLATGILILATPLGDATGFLVFITLPNYARTVLSILLGLGLLAAPWLKSFRSSEGDLLWEPKSSRHLKGFLVFPLALLFVLINLFVLVLYWFPPQGQRDGGIATPITSNCIGPVAMGIFGGAVLYWVWDRLVLPRLGCRMEIEDPDVVDDDFDVRITFKREISGISKTVVDALTRISVRPARPT